METIHDSGRIRLLGVSNVTLEQLQRLCQGARVRPRFVQTGYLVGRVGERLEYAITICPDSFLRFAETTIMLKRLLALLVLMVVALPVAANGQSPSKGKVLLIGKQPDHPYGSHMYLHTGRMLGECLRLNGLEPIVSDGWPKDSALLRDVKTIVVYTTPAAEFLLDGPHRDQVEELMKQGVGLVTIHWASAVLQKNLDRLGDQWIGYLGGTWVSNVGLSTDTSELKQLSPKHPICRGWSNYELHDEYYLNPTISKQAQPLLQVTTKGQDVVVGWAFERPGGGRAYATTLGHFYSNFQNESFRRAIVNAILWTAKVEVPESGARVDVPDEFLKLPPDPAQATSDAAFPPHRVIGNTYYVGSKALASYLITTPDGHFLINSGYEETVPLIRASVESLGFKMRDVKALLASHAHADHVAGHAKLKELTGAKVYVMRGDDAVIATGGQGQYLYDESRWIPCPVDVVLDDTQKVTLGGVTLVSHRTPGHTRGCTTWTWQVAEGDKKYDVVVIGSPNVNPGYRLVKNRGYPEIAADFDKTFTVLKSLPCDVFLGAHGEYYGMAAKYERAQRAKESDKNPFIDPEGYRAYVKLKEGVFRSILADQNLEKDDNRQ
ncbi:MAG: subclass B3 metallo-beta-lactamase [Planctomycetaceae bacterium]|nr:subclass B3 metallo-beta-lactamase [Planctomycetaceae bacterium]